MERKRLNKGKQKPVERKRMKKPVKPKLKTRDQARYEGYALAMKAKQRELKGLPSIPMTFTTAPTTLLALQVRENKNKPWGMVKGFKVHEGTPPRTLREYKEELERLKTGWMANAYFGSNASYRIGKVTEPGKQITYFI